MKVLFVTNRYPTEKTPGDSPCIRQQRDALAAMGHTVDVLLIDSNHSRLNYLKAMWSVFWRVQLRHKYDIVHAHYGSYCGLVSCAQRRAPVVITFRGSDVLHPRELPISKLAARSAHATVVMTEEMKRELDRPDTHVVPYGTDLRVFRPRCREAARRQLGLPAAAPLLLFPYDPRRKVKRYDVVEQSVQLLQSEFPDIQVVTVSDAPYGEMADYMNACDVMVLTSNREGSPVAVTEAMACNLPIVSVDVGDVRQTLEGTEGCFVVRQDPRDVADALAPLLRKRPRTKAHQNMANSDLRHAARTIADIYEQLLRRDRISLKHWNEELCREGAVSSESPTVCPGGHYES